MIYQLIRDYMEKEGLIFTVVANKAGIKPPAFISIINGKRKITAEEYYQICKALNVPIDYFYNLKKQRMTQKVRTRTN